MESLKGRKKATVSKSQSKIKSEFSSITKASFEHHLPTMPSGAQEMTSTTLKPSNQTTTPTNLPIYYYPETNLISPTYQQSSTDINMNTYDTFSSQTYFDPNEIFQLNNPIKNSSVFGQTSPQTIKSVSPQTVLDLESGTIHHQTSNAIHNQRTYEYKYDSCDDSASLISSSSIFDDGYYSVQGQTSEYTSTSPYSDQQFGSGDMNGLFEYYVHDGTGTQYEGVSYSQDYEMCSYPILNQGQEFNNYDATTGYY